MSSYHKRIAVCYFLLVAVMFVCVLRLCAIALNEKYKTVAEIASSKKISLGYSRGTIYDKNRIPITNAKKIYYNLIPDKPTALISLYGHFSSEEMDGIVAEIRENGFAIRYTEEKLKIGGVYSFALTEHNSKDTVAEHIVGYTDSSGRGVCGLEKAYDDLLLSEEENFISFTLDGKGAMLEGIEPTFSYDYKTEEKGVVTTVDVTIQQVAEKYAQDINSGAIVITEIESGKIRAIVSRPHYDITSPGDSLNDPKQPLLNRTLCTFNIGSVFKPYVAAAGYERKLFYQTECNGYTDIDGLVFSCHNLGGHGRVDMTKALKYSCNSFFYEFIQGVGARSVISVARKAGFENSIKLADGIVCRAGSLGNTALYDSSKRSLANLSIGQGELMLSPIAITNLYMAIAGGGGYRTPSLIEGTVENGEFIEEPIPAKVTVMSDSTVERLKGDLFGVLEEGGTGEEANPKYTTAAGKTGTAQTGILKNGNKVTNSWFCGFFPFDKPKYVVTILSENAPKNCGSIFSDIADEITLLGLK